MASRPGRERAVGRAAAMGLALALSAASSSAAPIDRTTLSAASLEGVWTNVSGTPLERPADFTGPTTTAAKAAAYVASSVAAFNGAAIDDIGGRQSEWFEVGGPMIELGGQIRTSVIVAPPDGKLPYSPGGLARMNAGLNARLAGFSDPEMRPSNERCLTGGSGSSGVPMFPHWDNSIYKIVQTKDHVAIWTESGGTARIIRLNETHHLPANMRPWMGDSIGHWEGGSLVVETTNFNPGETAKSPQRVYISQAAKVTERFTRLARDKILYDFTVDDPATYTTPWRGQLLFRTSKGPILEYACHEGNYSLPGILAGARLQEREAAK